MKNRDAKWEKKDESWKKKEEKKNESWKNKYEDSWEKKDASWEKKEDTWEKKWQQDDWKQEDVWKHEEQKDDTQEKSWQQDDWKQEDDWKHDEQKDETQEKSWQHDEWKQQEKVEAGWKKSWEEDAESSAVAPAMQEEEVPGGLISSLLGKRTERDQDDIDPEDAPLAKVAATEKWFAQ